MILEDAAIENGWARRGDRGQLVWRADDVDPKEVWEAAVASERKRMLAGYREIEAATDLQMRDGDLAREIAARMLGPSNQ
jgi:hypothetical protein